MQEKQKQSTTHTGSSGLQASLTPKPHNSCRLVASGRHFDCSGNLFGPDGAELLARALTENTSIQTLVLNGREAGHFPDEPFDGHRPLIRCARQRCTSVLPLLYCRSSTNLLAHSLIHSLSSLLINSLPRAVNQYVCRRPAQHPSGCWITHSRRWRSGHRCCHGQESRHQQAISRQQWDSARGLRGSSGGV